jgi:hypothetical protein
MSLWISRELVQAHQQLRSLDQAAESGIAIHLERAFEFGQVGGRVLAPAICGVGERAAAMYSLFVTAKMNEPR